jgi:hypothetical protein
MISATAFKKYMNQLQPIRINLADGRQIDVPHGEYLSLEPGGRIFMLWTADGGFELFNLTMVTSISAKRGAKKNK